MPQAANHTARAYQQEQSDTCKCTDDDAGNGAGTQRTSSATWRHGGGVGRGGASGGARQDAAGDTERGAVLRGDNLSARGNDSGDNASSSGAGNVIQTLASPSAVLLVRAADGAAGNLTRTCDRYAVWTPTASHGPCRGGNEGAISAGEGLGERPCRRV